MTDDEFLSQYRERVDVGRALTLCARNSVRQLKAVEENRRGKRLLFAEEYVKDLNATQAAIRAGYSESRAASKGCELLKLRDVRERVDALKSARSRRLSLEAEDVVQELARIGVSDIGQVVDDKGALKPLHEIPEATRRAISEWAHDSNGFPKVKFWDKVSALKLLAQHLRMLGEGEVKVSGKVEHDVGVSVEIVDHRQELVQWLNRTVVKELTESSDPQTGS